MYQRITAMPPKFVMMSEARIQFMLEVKKHEDLVAEITSDLVLDPETGQYDEGEVVGLVAAKFNIAMNGDYDELALAHIYDVLIGKMRGNRIERILH